MAHAHVKPTPVSSTQKKYDLNLDETAEGGGGGNGRRKPYWVFC